MIFSRTRVWPLLGLLAVSAAQAEETAVQAPSDTNWTSYNENVNGQRFVNLNQITPANAAQLGEVCRLKVDETGAFHTGILEIDGLLYFTTATDTLAVDATNCRVRWRHHYETEDPSGTPLKVNRGVAYANGVLYRGTLDSRLLAIDMASGKTLWQYQVGEPQQGEFFSSAPQVYQGLVIVGAAGGDWGTRGRIMAFDAKTGREVWRFYTIPRGDEPGADSWHDQQSAQTGGGGSWSTYTLDHASGEVFVPVGNPTPDLLPHLRPGDNLYTDSMVVLDAATGKLKWYHQLLSNDGQDLDLGAAPMLYYNSRGERMVALGSKDGYVYGINRENQQRVFKTPVTTIKNGGVRANSTGVEICPGPLGGVEWNGPAFDRSNKAIVVGSVDWCAIETAEEGFKFKPGQFNLGGTFKFSDVARGWVTSLDADIGAVRWKFETPGPMVSGIVPTAGGVIFAGDMKGNFFALNAADGKELYRSQTGGAMAGGVISYNRKSRQYVAAVAGNVSRLTFGVTGSPTLLIYALGGNGKGGAAPVAAAPAATSLANASGAEIYGKICANCHGGNGEGVNGPALKGLATRMDEAMTIAWIKDPTAKKPGAMMPKLYPEPLSEQAVKNVAAYVQGLK
ncbi:MAG: PQQ-binding-like beta-propeller repeat protein [Gammaproteobacteria bacterium]|nr:PQQ-binding-like beta-propeller repeat protein [Gammaproteobacteria bacterium]